MTTERQAIAISLSPEVKGLLAENGIDLVSTLRRDQLDVVRAGTNIGFSGSEEGLKSPELVILASAVAAPLVGASIVRIIDAIGRNRKAQFKTTEIPPTSDAKSDDQGNINEQTNSSHSVKVTFLGLHFEMADRYGA